VVARGLSSVTASASDTSPDQYSTVTAYGKCKDAKGVGIKGITCVFTWHYKTTTPSDTSSSNSSGVASDSRDISRATKGYTVVITVTATFTGVTETDSTSFTPQ
jgi:hypothetical protein